MKPDSHEALADHITNVILVWFAACSKDRGGCELCKHEIPCQQWYDRVNDRLDMHFEAKRKPMVDIILEECYQEWQQVKNQGVMELTTVNTGVLPDTRYKEPIS